MTRAHCGFCGRHADDCPGGLWRFGRSTSHPALAICRYCSRAAVRSFGELPDHTPTAVLRFPSREAPDVPPDNAA